MARQQTVLRGGGLLALFLLLVSLSGCNGPGREDRPQRPGIPSETRLAGARYVGARNCKECHGEIFNGWSATFHAYKFQPASSDFVIGDFSRDNTLSTKSWTAEMTKSEEEFFVTLRTPGKESQRFKVEYAIGSIWKQVYIAELPNAALRVLPVQWNVPTGEWAEIRHPGKMESKMEGGGMKSGAQGARGEGGPLFQYQCMGCHTTNSRVTLDAESDTYRTAWSDPGVSCEACHGPGSAHIAADIQDKSATILNPAKMADPNRAGMICGACHTRGESLDQRFAYANTYRPGGQLNLLFDEKPGQHPDGSPKSHHQQYNDWRNSGHARAGVMCWDCHSPHATGKSNRFQLKLPGSLLCASCHTVEPRGVHGLHSVNNCIGCHMPSTVQSAVPGDLRSHTFRVIRPEKTIEAGEGIVQPNSCNLCHYHRGQDPEDLAHFLKAVKKPAPCKQCHDKEELDDE